MKNQLYKAGIRFLLPLASAALLGACSVPRKGGFDDVGAMVKERGGEVPVWALDADERSEAADQVSALLASELTAETAVRIALVNNQHLQATFEELGVAQADLVQAGLLPNPTISGSMLFKKPSFSSAMSEVSVAMDLLDMVLMPMRKSVAADEFEQVKLEVAHEVLVLVREVRGVWYAAVAAEANRELAASAARGGKASAKLLDRQHAAGNLSRHDQGVERRLYQDATLDLYRAQGESARARAELARLLSVAPESLKLPTALPETIPGVPDEVGIAEEALAQRLDVSARRRAVEAMRRSYELASGTRWIGGLGIGGSFSRESSGEKFGGPTMELELPLFDQQQASLAKMAAGLRRAERELAAMENDARAQIAEAAADVAANARVAVFYRDDIVPTRRGVLEQTVLRYNGMLAGPHELIEAKREELEAQRELNDAIRDYWDALAALDLAAGGPVEKSLRPLEESTDIPAAMPARTEQSVPARGGHDHH